MASNDNGEHLYQLRVTGVSGVDLQVDEMSLSRLEAGPGTDIRAVGRVSNSRGDAAQGVVLQYVLSADATPSPGDAILYSVVLPPIPGAGIQEVRHRMTLPATFENIPGLGAANLPAEGFIIAELDPDRVVPDVDQDNNILAVPITLNPQCVDDDPRTNESRDTATDLSDAPMARREGVICPFTEDWYLLPANAGNVSIQLETMVGQGTWISKSSTRIPTSC